MLYRGARILIMDEPTAVLAPQETEELFRTLRAMTDRRPESIVLISHKLDEVLAIADRVTVLRRGKVTAAGMPAAGQTKRDLARLMVGRDLLELYDETPPQPGDGACSSARTSRPRTTAACRPCGASRWRSGPARSSGIAAVAGNGQSELAEVITACAVHAARSWSAATTSATGRRRDAIRRGVAHVPGGPRRRRQRPEPVARRQPDHEALSASRRWRAAG